MPDPEALPAAAPVKAAVKRGLKHHYIGTAVSIFFFVATAGAFYALLFLYSSGPSPRFNLDNVTVYSFNLSQPDNSFLNSKLLVTLSSQHPATDYVGVYYEKLSVYLSLGDSPLTQRTLLPKTYQGYNESTVWLVALSGNNVGLGPEVIKEVQNGTVMGSVKAYGWLNWKNGLVLTLKFRFQVDCPVVINFRDWSTAGDGMKKFHQLQQKCTVRL